MRTWQRAVGTVLAAAVAVGAVVTPVPDRLALLAVPVYIVVGWILAAIGRTRHYLDRNGHRTRSCPGCGGYLYRMRGDWVTKCHRCGWAAGWPGVRWLSRSVAARQLRRSTSLAGGMVIAVAVLVSVAGVPAVTLGASGNTENPEINTTAIERAVHEEINAIRAERGLSSLEYSTAIASVAEYHSRDMVQDDYFAHTAPDGEQMTDRYEQNGLDCQRSAENIAWVPTYASYETEEGIRDNRGNEERIAESLVNSWMNSPGHRSNILLNGIDSEGIGIRLTRKDGMQVAMATQNFCG